MNREIKFRAWDGNKIINTYDPFWETHSIDSEGYVVDVGDQLLFVNDEGITLMQFTGLKDVNGKEIYEGDVVEIRKDGKIFDEASRVIFSQYGGFQFYDMTFQDVFRDSNYDVRIIGNVFENPSLLK